MDSDSVKKAIIRQVLVESNTNNSRQLFERANEHCFDKCVPKPGSSMSSSEETCASLCMEKYIHAWNKVNQTLLQRLQAQQPGAFST